MGWFLSTLFPSYTFPYQLSGVQALYSTEPATFQVFGCFFSVLNPEPASDVAGIEKSGPTSAIQFNHWAMHSLFQELKWLFITSYKAAPNDTVCNHLLE